jgi:hypothetical protein
MADPKYKTLAELVEAIKNGSLDIECQDLSIQIDNDSTAMRYYDEDDSSNDVFYFDGQNPSCLLEQALTLLGVPWQNA